MSIYSAGHQHDREAADEREIAHEAEMDALQSRFDLLNDQNVRLATAMQDVKSERDAAFSALSGLVAALGRGNDAANLLPALRVARAVADKHKAAAIGHVTVNSRKEADAILRSVETGGQS